MKKLLLLTTCVLGTLVAAADPQDYENSRRSYFKLAEEFQENANLIDKLTNDRQVHARIELDCQYNASLNAFYNGRNPAHMAKRGGKIVLLTVKLSGLEQEQSELLETIMTHSLFPTMKVTGALMQAVMDAISHASLDKKSTKETKK